MELTLEQVRKYFCSDTRIPDGDLVKFIEICKINNLNPFAGDITLITFNNKVGDTWQTRGQACITISGYLKRATSHPEYRGYQAGIIVNDKDGHLIEREGDFLHPEENLLGCWCRVFFKSREPLKVSRNKEFYHKGDKCMWTGNREPMMLVKCIVADGLRKAFPDFFSGQYLPEEFQEPVQPTKKVSIQEFQEALQTEEAEPCK